MNDTTAPAHRPRLIDQKPVYAQTIVSRELADVWIAGASFEQQVGLASQELAIQLRGWMLADKLATDQRVRFDPRPASLWQHVKAVHFPTLSRWLRRPPRSIAQMATITVESWATFPHATIPYPEVLGRPVPLQEVTVEVGWAPEPDR